MLIDTRAAPASEVCVVLLDRRPADQPVAPPAQLVAAAATPLVPAPEVDVPPPLSRQAGPDYQTPKEQEPLTGSLTPTSGRSPGSAVGSTGKDTTAFFQIATQGKAIVYVLDRSGSMGSDGCLATAKHALLGSLEHLPSSVRFQIIAYNRSTEPLSIHGQTGLAFATPENKQCVARLLERIHAEGGTDHLSALKRALALGPDVIFLLTDADDLRADEIQKISFLNHGRCVIHAIGLGQACARHGNAPLNALAQENQGVYKTLPAHPE